jgi:hypothetical protein
MTSRLARACVAAASSLVLALAIGGSAAWSQTTPTVKVDPTSGAPGATFTITMNNYKACATPNCIIIDFIQGATTTRIGTADSHGSTTFAGQVKVPPTALAGPADVRAHVEGSTEDAKAGFTVLAAAATTTAVTSTTTSSTTSTSSTLLPPTSSTTSTTSTTVAPTTTTAVVKKDDEHSDVPRYIAVGLVVAAALATAVVDSRMRRLRG